MTYFSKRHKVSCFGLAVFGAVGLLSASMANAEISVLKSEAGDWTYDLSGFVFGPISTTGTSTVAGQDADLDMNLREALEVLDFTISGRFEAWNGNLGFAIEGNYLGISDDQSKTLSGPFGVGLDAEVVSEQSWVSLLAAYRFAHGHTASGNPYSFDVQAGARHNYLRQEIKISGPRNSIKLGGSESWWEPVIAVRGVTQLNDKWAIGALVDASGFGVNDNDLALSINLGFDWQAWENTAVKFGWRYYSIDYETNANDGVFGYDVVQHGPFIGLAWTFD